MKFLDSLFSSQGISSDIAIWILPALVGLLLIVVILLFDNDEAATLKKRLKRVRKAANEKENPIQKAISIRRRQADSNIELFDVLIKRFVPRPQLLRDMIARTGFHFTLGTYLAICGVLFLVVTTGCFFLSFIPALAAPAIGLLFGLGLPYFVMSFLASRRRNKFIQNFPEAIDLIVRGVKSGLPIGEAMKIAGDEIPDPVGTEFSEISNNIRLGKKLEDALAEAASKLAIQEFNFMTVAMAIQAETGGNLAETLSNLSDVLRRRRQLKLKIRALSSEAKTSAYIIGSLPFIMSVLIYLTNEDYLAPLWTDPRGHFAVALGLLWFAMGIGVMYKMVRFEI